MSVPSFVSDRIRFPYLTLGLVLALLGAACSSGTDLTLDAPVPTATPTTLPQEPTTEPTAQPTEVPTPEPTPEPEINIPGLLSAAGGAVGDVQSADTTITLDMNIAGSDLDTFTRASTDLSLDQAQVVLELTGSGWQDQLGENSDLAQPGSTLTYVLDGRTYYFTSDPLTEDLDPATPWILLTDESLIVTPEDPQGAAVELDPRDAFDWFDRLLENTADTSLVGIETVPGEDGQPDRETIHISGTVPMAQVVRMLPARTLGSILESDVQFDDFTGVVPVDLWLEEDTAAVARTTVVFDDLLDQAAELGAGDQLDEIELELTTVYFNLDSASPISIPDPDQIAGEPEPEGPTILEPGAPTNTGVNSEVGVRANLLAIGQCFTEDQLELVLAQDSPCTEPHIAEVFAVTQYLEVPGEDFPGADALISRGSEVCNEALQGIFGIRGEVTIFRVQLFRPSEETWDDGDRELACFVRYPETVTEVLTDLDPVRSFGLLSPFALDVGDCLVEEGLDANDFTSVPCTEPHYWEVFVAEDLPPGPWPGQDEIDDQAADLCLTQFETYVGLEYAASIWFLERLLPNENTWDNYNDRRLTCLLTLESPSDRSAQGTAE